MLKILYSEDTGLYENIIMVMASAKGLVDFIEIFRHSKVIQFHEIEGSEVHFLMKCSEGGGTCLSLSDEKISEMCAICEALLEYPIPAHNYVDMSIYTIMISKDEY